MIIYMLMGEVDCESTWVQDIFFHEENAKRELDKLKKAEGANPYKEFYIVEKKTRDHLKV